MHIKIQPITLPLPFRMGYVNCYLIETGNGYILIDTGGSHNRKELTRELDVAGCRPGLLKLIILTHGDFDHSGNAAYLREAFGARIAIHRDDAGMVERGDMFVNRKKTNILIGKMIPLFAGFGRSERFTPDLHIEDGDDLSGYGIDARVLSTPGHSKGSIGILTANNELFCGDLFENLTNPSLNSIMDDPETAKASVDMLKGYDIKTVYPGHGDFFMMEQFMTTI